MVYDPLELLKLKNGGEAPAAVVIVVHMQLERMMSGGEGIPAVLALYDLVNYLRGVLSTNWSVSCVGYHFWPHGRKRDRP